MFKKILLSLSLLLLLNISALARTYSVPSNSNNPFSYSYEQNNPVNNKYPVYYGPSDVPQQQQSQQTESSYMEAPVFAQSQQYPENPKILAELPPGTFVLDANSVWKFRDGNNYSGNINVIHPVVWRKLEDNHYSQGSTLLLSELTVAEYPFCVKGKGIRDWGESDIRKFLNGMFYRHFSQAFKAALVTTTIPYADLTGNPKTTQDNIFLLSIVEWDLSDRANNGTAIEYDEMRSTFYSKLVESYDNAILGLTSYANHQGLTRTINRPKATVAGYNYDVFTILPKGILSTVENHVDIYEVRPAINLKSNTPIKGPYKLKVNYKTLLPDELETPPGEDYSEWVFYMLDFPSIPQN